MDLIEVSASLFLSALKTIGFKEWEQLIKQYGTASLTRQAGVDGWKRVFPLLPEDAEKLRQEWDAAGHFADREIQLVENAGVRVKLWQSDDYPPLLRQLRSPPPILYIRGEDQNLTEGAVALVGSRRCSYYGSKVAKDLATGLVMAGVTTVSGLARGIDSVVHETTVNAGGKTWAVLGSGLGQLYPPENRRLAEEIEKKGAVISEFPMEMKPFPGNFPRRNRIIAGLSLATVVIEGSEKSGSLITARIAGEEGREVGAVPGPIHSPLSAASHMLIQMGAKLVRNVDDILEECGCDKRDLMKNTFSSCEGNISSHGLEGEILASLGASALHKEQLAQHLNQDPISLSVVLMEMEIKGLIQSLPGGLLTSKAGIS